MTTTIDDARKRLQAAGLRVLSTEPLTLWVAATVRGIGVSADACTLRCRPDGWVAVFPGEGLDRREVRRLPDELVALVLAVYEDYRRVGGPFKDAVARVVTE